MIRWSYTWLVTLSLALIAPASMGSPAGVATTLKGSADKSVRRHVDLSVPAAVPNFQSVHTFLCRGGTPTADGLEKLDRMGIRTIIDLRATGPATAQEHAWVERVGMHYLNLPIGDRAPTPQQVALFVQTVEAAQAQEGEKPAIYVHCQRGTDCTGCLFGIWRVTHDDYTYGKACAEMRRNSSNQVSAKLTEIVREYAQARSAIAMKP